MVSSALLELAPFPAKMRGLVIHRSCVFHLAQPFSAFCAKWRQALRQDTYITLPMQASAIEDRSGSAANEAGSEVQTSCASKGQSQQSNLLEKPEGTSDAQAPLRVIALLWPLEALC